MFNDDTDDTPELFDLGIGATLEGLETRPDDRLLGIDVDPDPWGDGDGGGGLFGREEESFGLRTGRFRGTRDGRFNDGSPPDAYDGEVDRFREADGRFDVTPDPVERPAFFRVFDKPGWDD